MKEGKVVELPPVKKYDLEGYIYREYSWVLEPEVRDADGNIIKPEVRTSYRIEEPVAFWWAPGHTTHRVVDAKGKVHYPPAPLVQGCVMSYEKKPGYPPVSF